MARRVNGRAMRSYIYSLLFGRVSRLQDELDVALSVQIGSLVQVHLFERKNFVLSIRGDTMHFAALHPVFASQKSFSTDEREDSQRLFSGLRNDRLGSCLRREGELSGRRNVVRRADR